MPGFELSKIEPGKIEYQNTPWNLVSLLFSLHEQKNLSPHFEFKSYLRQAKQFIRSTGDNAPSIMIMASQYTKHSFTFKYLKEFYEKSNSTTDK